MSLTAQEAIQQISKPASLLFKALDDRKISGDEAAAIFESIAAIPEVATAAEDVVASVCKHVGEAIADLLHRDPTELRAAAYRATVKGHDHHAKNLQIRADEREKENAPA